MDASSVPAARESRLAGYQSGLTGTSTESDGMGAVTGTEFALGRRGLGTEDSCDLPVVVRLLRDALVVAVAALNLQYANHQLRPPPRVSDSSGARMLLSERSVLQQIGRIQRGSTS